MIGRGYLRRDRRAATAVEFAIVGLAFITLMLLVVETGWQLVIGAALDQGARAASRFGATGSAAPPGISPPPPTRSAAVAAVVVYASGGLLNPLQLTVTMQSYPGFSTFNQAGAGTSGPGIGGQVALYTFAYTQPFLTGIAASIVGANSIVHHATVAVQNEPFPAS